MAREGITNDQLGDDASKVEEIRVVVNFGKGKAHFKPICWLVMAWIMPMGIVYTKPITYTRDVVVSTVRQRNLLNVLPRRGQMPKQAFGYAKLQ